METSGKYLNNNKSILSMTNANILQQKLKNLKPQNEFFIGLDSDGCVFDTMEIKHKECFCPNFIKYFELQKVSKYAREVWEFVNLYSKTRGVNRFLALEKSIELLAERPEIKERGLHLPDMAPLKDWIAKETQLGNPALRAYAEKIDEPVIRKALTWSLKVNLDIEEMVYGMGPFPYAEKVLPIIGEKTDALVVSQTPVEALDREWEESDIKKYVQIIAGQEYGTKKEHLALAAKSKYPDNKILMIGDAPGDLQAAKANGVLFYPINPGHENQSWKRFYEESLDRFLNLEFDDEYQQKLIDEFNTFLPEKPNWN
jgi:phosphoglycolate phosphatase-like HAD superfamily hydrolase